MASLCHPWFTTTNLSYRFPIFETSATALCGTTCITEGSLEVKLPTIWTDEKQRWEESERREGRREKIKEETVRRKKIQVCEKVGKSRNTVFFQWFVAPEGRKVGSLKRRERSQLARWEMKNCTPLWREAHFQVKMYKAPHVRSPFGSWDVEKVHAVVARSTFRSQNVQSASRSEPFWKLRCWKSARRCGAKHISKSKCTKHHMLAPLLDVEASFCVASARDCAPCQKWAKREGFCSISKNDGSCGTFEEDLQRCIFRGRCSTRDMFIRAVRRSGRWFPERGCILEHQVFRFAEMILRDRCSTSYDLASLFRGRRSTSDRWSGQIAKRIGTRPSALHSTFHFCRKSPRIASFLMLSTSKIEEVSQTCFVFDVVNFKIEEVSQNCFVFDVVKFKNWGSVAELFRFWCCQVQKMRQSRRIAAFSSLQLDRQTDRQTNR